MDAGAAGQGAEKEADHRRGLLLRVLQPLYMYACVRMNVCMDTHMHFDMSMHKKSMFTHTHTHTHTHIDTHTHTQTHTHTHDME